MPTATRGSASKVQLGPGQLFIAALGTPEPTDLTTAWATVSASWTPLGYTVEGSEFSYSVSSDVVDVAEELDIIDEQETGRTIGLSFALAELTAKNLKTAMNGGTITVTGVTPNQLVTFEPPVLGQTVKVALGWEAENAKERWVFRECKQRGDISIARRKGAEKASIPCNFGVYKPAAGGLPFKVLLAEGLA
jgi:hypothetical protein